MEIINDLATWLVNQVVGILLGILASFLASLLYARWRTRARRKLYGSLAGVWVEANDLLEDRPFAICEFFFSPSDGKLRFQGDSYDNKSVEYYKWWSIVLHLDDRERRLSYIYETQRLGETAKDEGFGCVFLQFDESSQTWAAQRGYFLDLDEAVPRFSRMLRFEAVAESLKRDLNPNSRSDRQQLVRELIRRKETAGLKKLFGWI